MIHRSLWPIAAAGACVVLGACGGSSQLSLAQACEASDQPRSAVVEGRVELPSPVYCISLDDTDTACRLNFSDGETKATLLVIVGSGPATMSALPEEGTTPEHLQIDMGGAIARSGDRVRVEGTVIADDDHCVVQAHSVAPP